MSKKTLLNEATIRRFAKLAQIPAMRIEETQTIEEDDLDEAHCPSGKKDDDLEEGMYGKKDDEKLEETDDLEEGMYGKKDDEKLEETEDLEEADMDMDDEPEMDMGDEPEMGEVEAEVKIDAGDLESLQAARDVIDQILAAGPAADDEPEMDMGMDDDEPPMMDDDEPPMMEIDDEKLQEMINRVTERVSKRIVKEALLRRVKKD